MLRVPKVFNEGSARSGLVLDRTLLRLGRVSKKWLLCFLLFSWVIVQSFEGLTVQLRLETNCGVSRMYEASTPQRKNLPACERFAPL